MLSVRYSRKSKPDQEFSALLEFPQPKTANDFKELKRVLQELEEIPTREKVAIVEIAKAKPVDNRGRGTDTRRQDYEQRKKVEGRQVKPLRPITWMDLFEFVGEKVQNLWLDELDIQDPFGVVDPEILKARYFHKSGDGLLLFLAECFPFSTSLSPFCDDQVKSVRTMESVIVNGGVQQCLEPRGYAKSARVSRSSIWAILGGFRRFPLCFQSSQPKARENVERVKTELISNKAIEAMFPMLVACCKHAKDNNRAVQEIDGKPTYIVWQVDEIRLPDIERADGTFEVYSGAALKAVPFANATGTSVVDPRTGRDVRPDLLLCDDVQSQRDAKNPQNAQTMLNIYYSSVRYLNGRTEEMATFFMQTIFEPEDMADRLRKDPSITTIRYSAVKKMPKNMNWWRDVYRVVLHDYSPDDPEGQFKAKLRAREVYLRDREIADEGYEVAWEEAYDRKTCASALQSLMNNYLTDEKSFWTQDQNTPVLVEGDNDIRCKASDIMAKWIPGLRRGLVPYWKEKIVCHIDCQDDLLYWAVCAGSQDMAMHVMDYQTWPEQSSTDFQLKNAFIKFSTDARYSHLPTMKDRLYAALVDLLKHLSAKVYYDQEGRGHKIDRFGIDDSDGDHRATVHKVCRDNPSFKAIPMKGWSPRSGQLQMGERKDNPGSKKGDHWLRHKDKGEGVNWLQADVSYYKARLHEGLKAPTGTSVAITLWDADNSTLVHKMAAEHCNAESAKWVQVTKVGSPTVGFYEWTELPGQDNHRFDNLVGCLVLNNYEGGNFIELRKPKQIESEPEPDTASSWENHPELYA